MPQKVNCQKCGAVLYEGEELKSPEEILQKNEGKCYNCGNDLSLTPTNVQVEAAPNKTIRGRPK